MSSNSSALSSSVSATSSHWWQNEDWLAVLAALPILIAVAVGWQPKMPSMGWSGLATASKAFAVGNLALSGVLAVG
jgi:hypothetical protein